VRVLASEAKGPAPCEVDRDPQAAAERALRSRQRARDTPPDGEYEGMWKVSANEVTDLERTIDECQKTLEPLKSFVLPRRRQARRVLASIADDLPPRGDRDPAAVAGRAAQPSRTRLRENRLSDLLFVLSRWIAKHQGEDEFLWERGLRLPTKRAAKKALNEKAMSQIYFKQLELGPMQNYVYFVGDPVTRSLAVVDPAWEPEKILEEARKVRHGDHAPTRHPLPPGSPRRTDDGHERPRRRGSTRRRRPKRRFTSTRRKART